PDADVKSLQLELQELANRHLPPHLRPSDYCFINEIPRLPNGKLDKLRLTQLSRERDSDCSHTPPSQAADEAANETEQLLVAIWEEVLEVKPVRTTDNFFELGGDSIQSIRITSRARQAGITIAPGDLLEWPTIRALASRAAKEAKNDDSRPARTSGTAPLTPIQSWFFELAGNDPGQWNQAMAFRISRALTHEDISVAVTRLLEHHEGLRTRFARNEANEWYQYVDKSLNLSLGVFDFSALTGQALREKIVEEVDRLHAEIQPHLTTGVRAAVFDLGDPDERVLFFVAHHLLVDAFSWSILVEDIDALLSQTISGRELDLPARTDSVLSWADSLAAFGRSDVAGEHIDYWKHQSEICTSSLPTDLRADDPPLEADVMSVSVSLDPSVTEALTRELREHHTARPHEVVLAALLQTLQRRSKRNRCTVGIERHGRDIELEETDIKRTVGWFTSYYPLTVDLGGCDTSADLLRVVKESFRGTPLNGISYGVLRYMTPVDVGKTPPDVLFNYLGNLPEMDGMSSVRRDPDFPLGTTRRSSFRRAPLLEVNVYVRKGHMNADFQYSRRHHLRETIEAIAFDFQASVISLVNHCIESEDSDYSPSDFPEVDLNQDQLDQLLSNLGSRSSQFPGGKE
ncbi:MAG: hypothetical protein KJO98_07970, partial [Rhodothermia bacterium]|nr:hypothetical protein [Rhodothermia bacterium]